MHLQAWLTDAAQQLEAAGIGTARLDCLVLLEDLLHKNRTHLLAHPETGLTVEQLRVLAQQVQRRSGHEPLAYIRGKTEFYGRDFLVDKRVLEPRPESETMIDLFKQLSEITHIIDLGCGSGALGITAHFLQPKAIVTLIDIDPGCLAVARTNLKKHNVPANVFQGDLLQPLPTDFPFANTVILANLPYVPETYQINQAALQEPRQAIFGGADGLDLYRQLFKQAAQLADKPHYILTESLPFQQEALRDIARGHSYDQLQKDDFIQLFGVY